MLSQPLLSPPCLSPALSFLPPSVTHLSKRQITAHSLESQVMEDKSQHGLRTNFGHNWQGRLWPVTLKSHPNHQVWGLKMQIPGPLSVTSFRMSGVGPKNLHLSCFPSDRSWRNLGLLVRLQLDFQGKASKATPIPLWNPLTTVGFLGVF